MVDERKYIGQLHCIYCGVRSEPVTHILFAREPEDIKDMRLKFETYHDTHCGPKSIGMILELPDDMVRTNPINEK